MKVPLTNIFVPQKIIDFSIRGAISGVGPWGLLACFAPPPSLPGLSLPLSQRPSHAAAAAAVPTRRRRPVRFFVCGGAGGGGGGEQQQDGDGEGGDGAIALALHTLETHTGREPPPLCSRGGGRKSMWEVSPSVRPYTFLWRSSNSSICGKDSASSSNNLYYNKILLCIKDLQRV